MIPPGPVGSNDDAALRAFFDQPTLQMGVTEMTEDQDMILVAINVVAASRLGLTPEQAQGRRISEFALPGPNRGVWLDQYLQALDTRRPVQFEQPSQLPGGEQWWAVTLAYIGSGPSGRPRFSYIVQDITERKQAEAAIQASENRFRLLFEQNLAGVFRSAPDGRILACNTAFARMLGFDGPDDVLALNARELYFDDEDRATYVAELEERGEVTSLVMRFRRRDGSELWGMETVRAIHGEPGEPVVYQGTLIDFTDYKRAEDARTELTLKLAHQAQHDALTSLPNRLLFQDRLGQALALARRAHTQVAVLYMDLDRFKQINDTLGHSAGDALLCEVARRLAGCIRESDTLARLGGDEFTVVLGGLAEAGDAMRAGRKLVEAMRQPFQVDGRELYVSVSLGISLFPGDGADAETLMVNADVAMYRAKDMGRDTFQWFSPEMNVLARERLELEGDLRRALAAGQLELHYQPQCDALSRIVGVEALMRWHHPLLGDIPPARFIPMAEECGLIVPIGEWALRRACAQAAHWRDAGHRWLRMSVNVSALQFRRDDWVDTVRKALDDAGLPAEALELEITESLLLQSLSVTTANLVELRELGVRVAIDDFGTGYSSLSYLHQLPITTLKIDQSFVREIGADRYGAGEDAPIVRTIVALARNLGMAVVAEGVETEAQRDLLLKLGCDSLQGYLLWPALPAAAVGALLAAEVAN